MTRSRRINCIIVVIIFSSILILKSKSQGIYSIPVFNAEETCSSRECQEQNKNLNKSNKKSTTCKDDSEECLLFASRGECMKNPLYMLEHCQESCKLCNDNKSSKTILRESEQYGVRQKIAGADAEMTLQFIKFLTGYMEENKKKFKNCRNTYELCSWWSLVGECNKNIDFMKRECAPSCFSCEELLENDFEISQQEQKSNKCARNPSSTPSLGANEINNMFNRIITSSRYSTTVHSRSPYVITIDNFLSKAECYKLMSLGFQNNFEPSRTINTSGGFSVQKNKARTSRQVFCNNDCKLDPTVQSILKKVNDLTSTQTNNYEGLQLLWYQVQQRYTKHHDFIPYLVERISGTRLISVFFYLNDVEEGGDTYFNTLDITIKPKQGTVLLWPNVLNDTPDVRDDRMEHEAMPVVKGEKFAANLWIYRGDFLLAQKLDCLR